MGIQRWPERSTVRCGLSNAFKIYRDLHLGSVTVIWHTIIYILPWVPWKRNSLPADTKKWDKGGFWMLPYFSRPFASEPGLEFEWSSALAASSFLDSIFSAQRCCVHSGMSSVLLLLHWLIPGPRAADTYMEKLLARDCKEHHNSGPFRETNREATNCPDQDLPQEKWSGGQMTDIRES